MNVAGRDVPGRGTAVTLDDVARSAGVSPSTVSRTLNGRAEKVSAATQARIRAAADQLGYAPNAAAQTIAVGRSTTVGLLVDVLPDDYQHPVAAGVFRAAARHDRLVLSAETGLEDLERARRLVNRLRGQRPAVLIVVGSRDLSTPGMAELLTELAHYEAEGGRVVLIGQPGTAFDAVVVDDHAAGRGMAHALHGRGYREFAVFCDGPRGVIGPTRMRGFVDGLAERGVTLAPDRVFRTEFSHDGGYRAAGELLGRRDRIEAVFCVNDAVAIGALVRLREAGVRVGPDVGLAGCDDLPALRDIDPPLSTVRLPWFDVAEEAFRLAAAPREPGGRTVELAGYPVLRASTPGPAAATGVPTSAAR